MKIKTLQKRKQRKRLFNLSLHQKRKTLTVTLSKELRAKFKRRNLAVRKGDRVKITAGGFKGTEGEVMRVDISHGKIYVDKATVKKRDGTETLRAMRPANLMLTDVDIRDKERQSVLQRKVSQTVIDEEVKKEEARMRKAEEERKAKEEAAKKAEAEKKAAEKKPAEGAPEENIAVKSIDTKTKKDWIAEK